MSLRPSQVSLAVLAWALTDPGTVDRYRQMIEVVPGWTCSWWVGALSGRGHGRFWLASAGGRDVAIIAHRFGFALEHGLEELLTVPVLGHRCDNPLCQLVAPRHVVRSSPSENRREWATRRRLAGGALADRRGARGRAREVRDAIRASCPSPGRWPRKPPAVRHRGPGATDAADR